MNESVAAYIVTDVHIIGCFNMVSLVGFTTCVSIKRFICSSCFEHSSLEVNQKLAKLSSFYHALLRICALIGNNEKIKSNFSLFPQETEFRIEIKAWMGYEQI